jgi:hypothetical protein
MKRAAKSKAQIDAAIVVALGAGLVSPAKLQCSMKTKQ